jgi:predicted permease
MGNAVVSAIFPEIFTEYILFTLPLWSLIYLWGAPTLLISSCTGEDSDKSLKKFSREWFKEKTKPFLNPMFAAIIIGMVIGLCGIKIPETIISVITVAGDCMSPIAMLLTGITLAGISLAGTFKDTSIYAVSVLRLLVFPLAFIAIFSFIPCSEMLVICAVSSLAMPLGLNSIVIPSAYGKDTTVASGMALVSHLLSCISIPIIFLVLNFIL